MITIFGQKSRWLSVLVWLFIMVMIVGAFVSTSVSHQTLNQIPDWSLRHTLPVADQFDINRISDGVEYPVTHLPDGQNPKMFGLLKHSGRFHKTAPREKADFIFDIPFGAGGVYYSSSGPHSCPTFDYVSKSGELGTGHDWCYVPVEFKIWMQRLKAKTPARRFQVEKTPYYTGAQEIKAPKTH